MRIPELLYSVYFTFNIIPELLYTFFQAIHKKQFHEKCVFMDINMHESIFYTGSNSLKFKCTVDFILRGVACV